MTRGRLGTRSFADGKTAAARAVAPTGLASRPKRADPNGDGASPASGASLGGCGGDAPEPSAAGNAGRAAAGALGGSAACSGLGGPELPAADHDDRRISLMAARTVLH